MSIAFVSNQDLHSFCTPALQFKHRTSVESLAAEVRLTQYTDIYQYFSAHSSSYQPIGRFYQLNATALSRSNVPNRLHDRKAKHYQTIALRPVSENTPSYNGDTARYTCLMVEGVRRFYRNIQMGGQRTDIQHHFTNNDYDCYGVWGRDSDNPLGEPLFEKDGRRVFVGRSGYGVLYASVPCFTPTLEVSGYNTHLTLVEFSIPNKSSVQDVVLRYSTQIMKRYGHSPTEPCLPWILDPKKFEPIWFELVKRAYEGFVANCSQRMPTELKKKLREQKERE